MALLVVGGVAAYFTMTDSDDAAAKTTGGAFDNLLTLDPCSYLEPKMFAGVADKGSGGSPQVRIQPTGFSICAVQVQHSGYPVTINLEARQGIPSEIASVTEKSAKRGSVTVTDISSNGLEYCPQFVSRADGTAVRLSASMDSRSTVSNLETLCKIRDVATDAAVAALTRGTAKSLAYPADSLGGVAPCTRLGPVDLRTVLGPSRVDVEPSAIPYSCTWQVGYSIVTLEAGLSRRPVSESISGYDSIDGRRTGITQLNYPHCILQVEGRTWEPWQGSHSGYPAAQGDAATLVELSTFSVQLEGGTPDDACDKAKALAGVLWPKLPKS